MPAAVRGALLGCCPLVTVTFHAPQGIEGIGLQMVGRGGGTFSDI